MIRKFATSREVPKLDPAEIKEALSRRAVSPVSLDEVEKQAVGGYDVARRAEEDDYLRTRGAYELLEPGHDYAELPGHGGQTAREIIESLGEGAGILDVGCGHGNLGSEIMGEIAREVEVWGFDAQEQEGQDRLADVVLGDVDDLSPEMFKGKRFDLVISSALLHHLVDPWGAIGRMSRMLEPGGKLLVSTVPIGPAFYEGPAAGALYLEALSRERSGVEWEDYHCGKSFFGVDGRIIPPAEVVEHVGRRNPGFQLEYSIASTNQVGVIRYGGRVSAKRPFEGEPLDLSYLFYCQRPYAKGEENAIAYILAKTDEEKAALETLGYKGVEDRINPSPA